MTAVGSAGFLQHTMVLQQTCLVCGACLVVSILIVKILPILGSKARRLENLHLQDFCRACAPGELSFLKLLWLRKVLTGVSPCDKKR
jgi:hypothetical protein